MKNRLTSLSLCCAIMTTLAALGITYAYAGSATTRPATDAIPASIAGTWELIDHSGFDLMNSPPHGLAAWKFYFTQTGKLHVIPGQETLDKQDKGLSYQYTRHDQEAGSPVLTLDIPDQGKLRIGVEFPSTSRMVLIYGDRNRWTYQKMSGEDAFNREIEPRSIAILQTTDEKDQLTNLDIRYDTADYSKLPVDQRIVGVWERMSVTTVPAADFPPYGFLNHKWVFTPTGDFHALTADQTQRPEDLRHKYAVTGKSLVLTTADGQKSSMDISFNKWGHLELRNGRELMTFKLLSKKHDVIQAIPVKIILALPREAVPQTQPQAE